MPRIDEATVSSVANLARLSLTGEERLVFARELEAILAWAGSLQALDTADVPPMSHPLADQLRDDEPRESLPRASALDPAPDAADGLFREPRVIPE